MKSPIITKAYAYLKSFDCTFNIYPSYTLFKLIHPVQHKSFFIHNDAENIVLISQILYSDDKYQ